MLLPKSQYSYAGHLLAISESPWSFCCFMTWEDQGYSISTEPRKLFTILQVFLSVMKLPGTYRQFNTIQGNLQIQRNPYENTNSIFHVTRTNNPKFCTEAQKTQNSQSNPEKNRAEDITFLDFKLCYKATVTKAVLYWHKNRHIDQQNRDKSLERSPYTYDQIIYEKRSKNIQ